MIKFRHAQIRLQKMRVLMFEITFTSAPSLGLNVGRQLLKAVEVVRRSLILKGRMFGYFDCCDVIL